VLENFANMKDDQLNYSRGLAFRRAAATLASLPVPITRCQQLANLPDVGEHCKKIIEVRPFVVLQLLRRCLWLACHSCYFQYGGNTRLLYCTFVYKWSLRLTFIIWHLFLHQPLNCLLIRQWFCRSLFIGELFLYIYNLFVLNCFNMFHRFYFDRF